MVDKTTLDSLIFGLELEVWDAPYISPAIKSRLQELALSYSPSTKITLQIYQLDGRYVQVLRRGGKNYRVSLGPGPGELVSANKFTELNMILQVGQLVRGYPKNPDWGLVYRIDLSPKFQNYHEAGILLIQDQSKRNRWTGVVDHDDRSLSDLITVPVSTLIPTTLNILDLDFGEISKSYNQKLR